jgi:2-succinyl-5-enolpyruvyl-6-hydroxy-3-cyclohexene-1-carboxylate synthase
VELHPAVVEADLSGVPLIACTADRPPELQDIGAPQTINQTHLFGPAVRWFCEPGVPDGTASHRDTWRSLGARAAGEARGAGGRGPGPVHVNLAFRDPLVGEPGPLPPGRPDGGPWHRVATGAAPDDATIGRLAERLTAGRRGVIVAGGGAGVPAEVHALADRLGWPVLADPRSGARLPLTTTVAHADAMLRSTSWAGSPAARPAVVLRLGAPHASKVLGQWLTDVASCGADIVAVVRPGRWLDPERIAGEVVVADPGAVVGGLLGVGTDATRPAPDNWLTTWATTDQAAGEAIAGVLSGHAEPTEPAVARAVVASAPAGSHLVVASSMPIRDVEWYAAPRDGLTVVSNRGANGIDGVVSTAVGVAAGSGTSTTALVGDIAFLHDANALVGAAGRGIDLHVVVVDNDGGGIFSFLPQASRLDPRRFELLFGTPHGVDIAGLAAGLGIEARQITASADLVPALYAAQAGGGVAVTVVRTDRQANVRVHDELHAAVIAAIG